MPRTRPAPTDADAPTAPRLETFTFDLTPAEAGEALALATASGVDLRAWFRARIVGALTRAKTTGTPPAVPPWRLEAGVLCPPDGLGPLGAGTVLPSTEGAAARAKTRAAARAGAKTDGTP